MKTTLLSLLTLLYPQSQNLRTHHHISVCVLVYMPINGKVGKLGKLGR